MSSRLSRAARLALGLAGLAAVLGAFVVGRASSSPTAGQPVIPPVSANASSTDAQSFAVRAIRELNSPRMVDPSYRSAALARFLDPSAGALADRFVPGAAFEEATGLSADRDAGRTAIAEVVPLALSVPRATQNDVELSVWAVSVVGTRRFGQLVASWSTETVTVRHETAGWRVVDYRSTPGPVPAATQPPTDVLTALAAVTGMRSASDGP